MLSETLIDSIFDTVEQHKHRVKLDRIASLVNWRNASNQVGYGSVSSRPEEERKPLKAVAGTRGGSRRR